MVFKVDWHVGEVMKKSTKCIRVSLGGWDMASNKLHEIVMVCFMGLVSSCYHQHSQLSIKRWVKLEKFSDHVYLSLYSMNNLVIINLVSIVPRCGHPYIKTNLTILWETSSHERSEGSKQCLGACKPKLLVKYANKADLGSPIMNHKYLQIPPMKLGDMRTKATYN